MLCDEKSFDVSDKFRFKRKERNQKHTTFQFIFIDFPRDLQIVIVKTFHRINRYVQKLLAGIVCKVNSFRLISLIMLRGYGYGYTPHQTQAKSNFFRGFLTSSLVSKSRRASKICLLYV